MAWVTPTILIPPAGLRIRTDREERECQKGMAAQECRACLLGWQRKQGSLALKPSGQASGIVQCLLRGTGKRKAPNQYLMEQMNE